MSFFTVLTLIFVVLKLTNYIDWSWWWVITPSIVHAIGWIVVTLWWESLTPSEKLRWKLGM